MRPSFSALVAPVSLFSVLFLAGCGAASFTTSVPDPAQTSFGKLQGSVFGGQQPITGAHVYLFAANTTGYGAASVSLLSAGSTGLSDSVGAYVLTDSNGAFSITNDYTCTPGQQVYMLTLGGNPGAGANAGAALMAILGACPAATNFSSLPFIFINEITTVAAAYSFSGFAVDATHVSDDETAAGNTTQAAAKTGMANAFANAANLVSTYTGGTALATTPGGNGTVPQQELNTLANILAACVNSNGSTVSPAPCYTLFNNATNGATVPTETATAAINIAHNPASNVANLYGLQSGTSPFGNKLSSQPNDFTVALYFTGGGINSPQAVAIDGSGNAWVPGYYGSLVAEFSPLGAAITPTGGYTGSGNIEHPEGIAIDPTSTNVWLADYSASNPCVELTATSGAFVRSVPVGTGGLGAPTKIAFDASGHIWLNNPNQNLLTELDTSGNAISPSTGYTGSTGNGAISGPKEIAFDNSGNVWVANYSHADVVELNSSGSPLSGTTGYTASGFNQTWSVATDSFGNAWVGTYNGGMFKFTPAGVGSFAITTGGINYSYDVEVDGLNRVWVADRSNDITELGNDGTAISPSTGYQGGNLGSPIGIALDGSGNVWVANGDDPPRLTEFVGAAAPVVVPLSLATAKGKIATRP